MELKTAYCFVAVVLSTLVSTASSNKYSENNVDYNGILVQSEATDSTSYSPKSRARQTVLYSLNAIPNIDDHIELRDRALIDRLSQNGHIPVNHPISLSDQAIYSQAPLTDQILISQTALNGQIPLRKNHLIVNRDNPLYKQLFLNDEPDYYHQVPLNYVTQSPVYNRNDEDLDVSPLMEDEFRNQLPMHGQMPLYNQVMVNDQTTDFHQAPLNSISTLRQIYGSEEYRLHEDLNEIWPDKKSQQLMKGKGMFPKMPKVGLPKGSLPKINIRIPINPKTPMNILIPDSNRRQPLQFEGVDWRFVGKTG